MPAATISHDGTLLFLGVRSTVTVMRISDGLLLDRTDIPVDVRRMVVSPAGGWLVVFSNDFRGAATRVDLR